MSMWWQKKAPASPRVLVGPHDVRRRIPDADRLTRAEFWNALSEIEQQTLRDIGEIAPLTFVDAWREHDE